MVDKLTVSSASQAGSKLLRRWRIITLNPDNNPVLDMELQWTSATAIVGSSSSYDFQTVTRLGFFLDAHIHLLIVGAILQVSAVGLDALNTRVSITRFSFSCRFPGGISRGSLLE